MKLINKKQAGFTLIELIIVIVILGILAVTAAPKFLNLQGDAHVSTLKGVEGAIDGASSIVYGKSVILGIQNIEDSTSGAVTTVFGYPAATSAGIGAAMDISTNDFDIDYSGATTAVFSAKGATSAATCSITFTEPTVAGGTAETSSVLTGC